MTKQATKPGKYGTLRLYRVHYRDGNDPAAPAFTSCVWRYSTAHVYEAFTESLEGDSWEIVRVETVPYDFARDHRLL